MIDQDLNSKIREPHPFLQFFEPVQDKVESGSLHLTVRSESGFRRQESPVRGHLKCYLNPDCWLLGGKR